MELLGGRNNGQEGNDGTKMEDELRKSHFCFQEMFLS